MVLNLGLGLGSHPGPRPNIYFFLGEIFDHTDNFELFSDCHWIRWIHYAEASYSLTIKNEIEKRFKPNLALMRDISETPMNWDIENDEELSELLKDLINTDHPGIFFN